MVYETDDGAVNRKVITKDEYKCNMVYSEPDRIGVYLLTEPRKIKRIISVTDTVPISESHIIPVPVSLNKVKSWRDWVASGRVDMNSITNEIDLHTLSTIQIRLVDAANGRPITDSIAVDQYYSQAVYSNPDYSVKNGIIEARINHRNYHDVLINLRFIIAKGYIPIDFFDGIKVEGNKFTVNGVTGTIDKKGIGHITLPMRRKTFDGRKFFITNVYYRTLGTDSIAKTNYTSEDELPWDCTRYSGSDTHVAYEGEFQPKRNGKTMSTLAITLAAYDIPITHHDRVEIPLVLEYQTTDNQTRYCKLLPSDYEKYSEGIYENLYGYHIGIPGPDINTTLYLTYEFCPGNTFMAPEQEGDVYAIFRGHRVKLGKFKNLTKDTMYLSGEAATEAPLADERVSYASSLEELGNLNDPFSQFDMGLPTTQEESGVTNASFDFPTSGVLLPFDITVQRINGMRIIRGVMSYNFLPGGPMMDMIDKTDKLADLDKLFFDIQREVTKDKKEYAREDRALGFSTAFAGVRGWLEGRFMQTKTGYFAPGAAGMGIKTEVSGYANTGLYNLFFRSGITISGELSTYAAIEYPDTTNLGLTVKPDTRYFNDFVQHTTVAMNTSVYVQGGIDLYLARAMVGTKGSLGASFDSEVRYRPWLRKYKGTNVTNSLTYSGSRMWVGGKVEAYAEFKFLWWKYRKSYTLAEFNKTWYDPAGPSNPLWTADQNSAPAAKVLRSSVYKPLKLSAAPENTNIILKDIDTYAEPRYLFGGKDLAYNKMNAKDMSDSHMMFRSGKTFNGGKGEPIVSADVSSTANRGIMAYEVSTGTTAEMENDSLAARHVGIKASLYNGSAWTAPVMLSEDNTTNFTPRTAVDNDGNAAVVWKSGKFMESEWGDELPGNIDGTLMMRRYNGTAWGEATPLIKTDGSRSVSDYAMAMLDGKPYMLAAMGTETESGPSLKLAALTYGADDTPMVVYSSEKATKPQLVNFQGKLFGAGLVAKKGDSYGGDGDTRADIHLYEVTTEGIVQDLGALGLESRNIMDFRLVKSDDALAVVWRESLPVLNDATNTYDFVPAVYSALVRSAEGQEDNRVYFTSCPQLLAKSENGLDISYFDAYLPDNSSVTGVVTLYDPATGGANVVETTNYFDNDFVLRHAGIDTKVEDGRDYGYYVVVFNEGKDVIDFVDLKFGADSDTRTIETQIYPGKSEVLTDVAFYTNNIENGIEPIVTPHFNESPLKIRSYTQAKAETARRRTVNRRRSMRRNSARKANPKIQLQVVDMDVRPLSVLVGGSERFLEAEPDSLVKIDDKAKPQFADSLANNYTMVLMNVIDNSPVSQKSDYKTTVSLYYDMAGHTPYEYVNPIELTPANFKESGSAVARIKVGKVPEDVTLYAVAHTTDADGNIINDQDLTNNATSVQLTKNELTEVPAGVDDIVIDTPEDAEEQTLDVTKVADGAMVKGLTPGNSLFVYDTRGVLIHLYRMKADETEHFVRLDTHGVYIFKEGKRTAKMLY